MKLKPTTENKPISISMISVLVLHISSRRSQHNSLANYNGISWSSEKLLAKTDVAKELK
jgi:hypothetical protein